MWYFTGLDFIIRYFLGRLDVNFGLGPQSGIGIENSRIDQLLIITSVIIIASVRIITVQNLRGNSCCYTFINALAILAELWS
ncbi:unnamed protein product [Rhizophagus irregularis]|uniref:Uncharacterized protein n=1 Tax=Rhizophagus irregularis TaxID=588596 RepID=A0A915ZK14_9GLOM|nr:unnamed protein product [Rhizophagus irregularis]